MLKRRGDRRVVATTVAMEPQETSEEDSHPRGGQRDAGPAGHSLTHTSTAWACGPAQGRQGQRVMMMLRRPICPKATPTPRAVESHAPRGGLYMCGLDF